jgi:hypothetical protein
VEQETVRWILTQALLVQIVGKIIYCVIQPQQELIPAKNNHEYQMIPYFIEEVDDYQFLQSRGIPTWFSVHPRS